jgi:hypothetical protein
MLEYLHLKNVGPAPEMRVDFAPRLNVITGDNSLGKSFLLDVAWWALTRTWAGSVALPSGTKSATIDYVVHGKAGPAKQVHSKFRPDEQAWPVDPKRPPMPGIVLYIRIDGGFSVWDPARNYWRKEASRPAAYHFDARQVWDGLTIGGQKACEGLERDWVRWQEGKKPQFAVLERVLEILSPLAERLRPGPPKRVFLGEGFERPTLTVGKAEQVVPVALASAGVRRILALSYLLVWAWHEHRVAAELLRRAPEDRVVVLFDEPETHLHPRWQRTIVPSLLGALDVLRGTGGRDPQVLIATHAPLILASLEPRFRADKDELFHLRADDGAIHVDSDIWAKQGDVTNWLVSDVFGLEQARSVEAERAIETAERFMRGETDLPEGLRTQEEIHAELQRLLPAHDDFWPRWLVEGKAMKLVRPGRKGAPR